MSFKVPEKNRIAFKGLKHDALNGHFKIFLPKNQGHLFAIASNHAGWEHVSVSKIYKGSSALPNWSDMCRIKNLFWDEEDCVVQFHPPKQDYVNICQYALHLWRPIGIEFPRPPKQLVF